MVVAKVGCCGKGGLLRKGVTSCRARRDRTTHSCHLGTRGIHRMSRHPMNSPRTKVAAVCGPVSPCPARRNTFPQQPTLSATTHLRNNHMYGGVNIGAFIKYYIGAFNIELTEYNHNL